MKRKTPFIIVLLAASLPMVTALAHWAHLVVIERPLNLSSTTAPTEKARIVTLSYVDGAEFVKPVMVIYADGDGTPGGELNIYSRRSFDKGVTWEDAVLVSSYDGQPTGGRAITVDGDNFVSTNRKASIFAPQTYAMGANRNVLITWSSTFCPDLVTGQYPNVNQQINTDFNSPYYCLWIARSIDAGASWITEQMTDGNMDVINDVVAGSQKNNAFSIAWQADPRGLQPGEAEGPGDGGSGAHVTPGTNIWYAYSNTLEGADPVFRSSIVQVTDNNSTTMGQPGASRVNLHQSGMTAALAYEENKGGGGKNIYYHAFAYNNPDINEPGLLLNNPARHARRVRFVMQGNESAGSSLLRVLLLYRQSDFAAPGVQADIMVQRGLVDPGDAMSTGYRPEDIEPFTEARNISDPNGSHADDNARAHRAIIRGDFIAAGYNHTPNMVAADPKQTTVPTDTYHFYIRISRDGGATWSPPANLTKSRIDGPLTDSVEPRLVATPGTIVNPLTGVPDEHYTQDTNIFYVVFATHANDGSDQSYTVYLLRSADQGHSYYYPVPVIYSTGQSEAQLRTVPSGSYAYSIWMQEQSSQADKDVYYGLARPVDVHLDSPKCFIATAAYGTPLSPEVRHLREFRDRYLLTSAPGKWLVDTYYEFSPALARYINDSEILRTVMRLSLTPLVITSHVLAGDDSDEHTDAVEHGMIKEDKKQ